MKYHFDKMKLFPKVHLSLNHYIHSLYNYKHHIYLIKNSIYFLTEIQSVYQNQEHICHCPKSSNTLNLYGHKTCKYNIVTFFVATLVSLMVCQSSFKTSLRIIYGVGPLFHGGCCAREQTVCSHSVVCKRRYLSLLMVHNRHSV